MEVTLQRYLFIVNILNKLDVKVIKTRKVFINTESVKPHLRV